MTVAPTPTPLLPFWSDDFDMDLLTVLPEARRLLGRAGDVPLRTHCSRPTYGRLNQPCVWNSYEGLVAFFGFHAPMKPETYWTDAPIVECTFLEAVRDAWVHGYLLLVEGRLVLNALHIRPALMALMGHLRRYARLDPAERELHLRLLRSSLSYATRRLEILARDAGRAQ